MKRQLKINLQKEISSYPSLSLRLCAILTSNDYNEWFMNNFINLKSYIDFENPDNIRLSYIDYEFDSVINYKHFSIDKLDNINVISILIDSINNNQYIIIFLDEFFLPIKNKYQKIHFVHPQLIYGFDNSKEVFYAVGNNKVNEQQMFEIDYKLLEESFNEATKNYFSSAPYAKDRFVESFMLKTNIKNDFDKVKIIKKIKNFILSENIENETNQNNDINKINSYIFTGNNSDTNPKNIINQINKFGLNTTSVVYKVLSGELKYNGIQLKTDFRRIQLISEQRKNLLKRMTFINSNEFYSDKISELLTEYQKIVNNYENMKLIYFKQILKEYGMTGTAKIITDQNVLNLILTEFKKNIVNEKELLFSYLEILKDVFNN